MGPRPVGGELDRIDNNGPYSPENCRWVNKQQNCRNRRSNVMLTLNGETMTAVEWGERTGIPGRTIRERVKLGWSAERAITEPINPPNHAAFKRLNMVIKEGDMCCDKRGVIAKIVGVSDGKVKLKWQVSGRNSVCSERIFRLTYFFCEENGKLREIVVV